MNANPFIKPKIMTSWLVVASAGAVLCLGYSTFAILLSPTSPSLLLLVVLSVIFATAATTVWFVREQRAKRWTSLAVEQWQRLETTKLHLGTTTEVTLLAIEAVEPTGTWVTLRWNQFDHLQQAWMEPLPDEIWEGAVLLISPDRAQIQIGSPWPPIYYLSATKYHGFAPAAALADFEKLRR